MLRFALAFPPDNIWTKSRITRANTAENNDAVKLESILTQGRENAYAYIPMARSPHIDKP